MARKKKKPSNTSRSHLDYSEHKKVADHTAAAKRGRGYSNKAASSSKGSGRVKGTDGVDYDGQNRRDYNIGRMLEYYHSDKAAKSQSVIDERKKRRRNQALRINKRQRPLQ